MENTNFSSKKIFGCCWDGTTLKRDFHGTNCPINYSYCPDETTIKKDKNGTNCFENINNKIKNIVNKPDDKQKEINYNDIDIYNREK